MCPTPSSGDSLRCWNCSEKSKYKCPKCETRSCSLTCVRKHKLQDDCDGVRDKVKYLSLNKFTDMDVVNDFRLLEEVTSSVDKCKRDKLKRSTRQGTETTIAPRLSKPLQRLQLQARRRRVTLKILPPHFTRRKENDSYYDGKERVIKWKVVLKLINLDKEVVLPPTSETTKLWRLIEEFVEFKSEDDPSDPYQHYRSVSYGGLTLLLKGETLNKNGDSKHFYHLDMKRSLKTNLKEMTLVEHPIIYVVFKTDEHLFRDEEEDQVPEKPSSTSDNLETSRHVRPDNVGDVMCETEAMKSDPEAYKQYFDFYLKYYTKKYAQQGVTTMTPPQLPAPPPSFSTPPPDYSLPPPNYSLPPPNYSVPPLPVTVQAPAHPLLFQTPPPQPQADTFSVPPPTIKIHRNNTERKNFFFEDNAENNTKNYEAASQIKTVIQQDSKKSSLVQYDMSDSEPDD